MVEKKRVVRTSTPQTADRAEVHDEMRCTHVSKDGRRCQQWRWAGKEVCYQHDKTRLGAQKLKEGSRQSPGFTVAQLQELLAMAMGQVLFGKMPVGQAYALGYLAQQSLAATEAAAKEKKVDVKHFWEMVDMGATFERAAELSKERKKEKAEARRKVREVKEAEEAEEVAAAEFTAEDTDDAEGRKGGEETADGG